MKLILIAPLVLCSTTLAQDLTQSPQRQAWQEFQRTHPGHWVAHWDPGTGTPDEIYGQGLRLPGPIESLGEARAAAQGVLNQYSTLLGRGDSDFVERIGSKVKRVFILVYDQQYRGLPVLGGRADVIINENGVVSLFGSAAVQIPVGFDLQPTVSAVGAKIVGEEYILSRRSQKQTQPAPRLVIWTNTVEQRTSPHLAWEIQIDERPEQLAVGKAYVDAIQGTYLGFENEVFTCGSCTLTHVSGTPAPHTPKTTPRSLPVLPTTSVAPVAPESGAPAASPISLTGTVWAWTNLGLKPTDPLSNVPLANVLVRVQGTSQSAYTDANGDFSISNGGTAPKTVLVDLEGLHSDRVRVSQGTQMTTATVVTPGTPALIQFGSPAMGLFERSQTTTYYYTDKANVWLRSLVPAEGSRMDTMSGMRPLVNINDSCNAYYTGFTINFFHESATCNQTSFSTIIYHEWGHGLDAAFGGISQTDGLSEGWGDILGLYGFRTPYLGESFRISGGYLRTGLNNRTYPAAAGAGVHTQGQTWMGFAWDVSTNLVNQLGTTQGWDTAINLIIPSIVADATDQPSAVLRVFIIDDDDGNLNNGSPHFNALEAAAVKRTLPYPQIPVANVTHTPVADSEDLRVSRIVTVEIEPLIAPFPGVEVVYHTTPTTEARRLMMPTGNPNEWVGLLPAPLEGVPASYHFEAWNLVGNRLRFPDDSDFPYYSGKLLYDDLERAEKGWTHVEIATQDDWQRGFPTGQSGTSNGVGWADPFGSASGSESYGNDIGPSGFNGAYQANVENYLRSPAISTLGKTGITLRFNRWLTVERNDVASILVNGVEVWRNSPSTHHLDTAWTAVELPIPSADNLPVVQIDWRLASNGSIELGGWNIDDVEIVSDQTDSPTVLLIAPFDRVDLGTSGAFHILGTPNSLVVLAASTDVGPLQLPGFPTLFIGPSYEYVGAILSPAGYWGMTFDIPNDPLLTGQLFYCQAIEFLSGAPIGVSNGGVVLIGK